MTAFSRIYSRSVGGLLRILRHAPILGGDEPSAFIDRHTEALLNLPGNLAFFPTLPNDPGRVRDLLSRLHPISCSRPLIRLGPKGDGGYLVPDDLRGIEACFSPGVNTISGFELDCAERGMDVYMADASVSAPLVQHPRFRFIRKFIGANTAGNFINLEDWVQQSVSGFTSDLLLQMDIEGYEYEAILSASPSLLRRFRIIVAEFHFLDRLFSQPLGELYTRVFDRILASHACVHIHPNNISPLLTVGSLEIPQLAEFTFLRRDRIGNFSFARDFPHPLDCENTTKPPLPLPKSCYRA